MLEIGDARLRATVQKDTEIIIDVCLNTLLGELAKIRHKRGYLVAIILDRSRCILLKLQLTLEKSGTFCKGWNFLDCPV